MSVESDGFYLSFVPCFPFLHFANYPVYKFNISLFKRKHSNNLNAYFNFDNQMRKIRDEQLYPVWGIFVSDLRASILITLLLFVTSL